MAAEIQLLNKTFVKNNKNIEKLIHSVIFNNISDSIVYLIK